MPRPPRIVFAGLPHHVTQRGPARQPPAGLERASLWQGRFFSSPLDDAYLGTAMRYVECNPVRAGMVLRAEDYRWSSAAAHCANQAEGLLNPESNWGKKGRSNK